MIRILGIDDSVNTCDCCGKTNLKHTVIVDDGEIRHYGSVCATKHTGLAPAHIQQEVKAERYGRVAAARKEYRNSTAHINLERAIGDAHRKRIPPGRTFRDYIALSVDEDEIVKAFIARKHSIGIEDLL